MSPTQDRAGSSRVFSGQASTRNRTFPARAQCGRSRMLRSRTCPSPLQSLAVSAPTPSRARSPGHSPASAPVPARLQKLGCSREGAQVPPGLQPCHLCPCDTVRPQFCSPPHPQGPVVSWTKPAPPAAPCPPGRVVAGGSWTCQPSWSRCTSADTRATCSPPRRWALGPSLKSTWPLPRASA